MFNLFIVLGSIGAALGVALGAFGAHGLEGRLTEHYLKIYQTGVQYHMYHALGLIMVGLISSKGIESSLVHWAGWLLVLGIILFSGSLYILAITGISKLGMITPLGGLAFIVGWVLLAISMFRA
ncbi:DUF423 domain-containing protein [Alkalihalobacillus sp. BA299]|uniref:DUF423 domain-containing protein n=1 Tax=Alkalihalobacillus sp. BA299 TaxID=2815938 RepID=UPI001ADB71AF|nr:DUF423 domain-containing protein [Alkalihalobacillus sp. BA299]